MNYQQLLEAIIYTKARPPLMNRIVVLYINLLEKSPDKMFMNKFSQYLKITN